MALAAFHLALQASITTYMYTAPIVRGLRALCMRYTLDALGRPTSLMRDSGAQWTFKWNALGYLSQITDPDGEITIPHLGPGGLWGFTAADDPSHFLRIGDWAISERGTHSREWMRDESGQSRLTLSEDSDPQNIDWSPLGMPDLSHGGLRRGGALQVPWTGLVVDSIGATEVLSGQRLQHLWAPAWRLAGSDTAGWPLLGQRSVPWWAPDPWMEPSSLPTPLDLALSLGLVDANFESDWTSLKSPGSPLPWLPPSAGAPAPPIGPPKDSIPMRLSPLESLCLQAATSPVTSIDTTGIGLAILAPEFEDLPSLEWLSTEGWTWWLMGADQWLALP